MSSSSADLSKQWTAPNVEHAAIWVWLIALAVFAFLWLGPAPDWMSVYPRAWEIPAARWISSFTKWLVNDATFGLFTFTEMTRFFASVIEVPYRLVLSLLATGFLSGKGSSAVQIAPPLSWIAIIGIAAIMGQFAGGVRLAVLMAACFGFIVLFGQWEARW